ncbi:long-chain acyl-CoA synthetase [Candidatus Kryptonium thompsonii]|uniref:Long-chain acyl-CoA synthetase n=3 Tax=Candidatus Kryptonium thompsonii TaxID=1633631 RepID=A0A0P1LTH3_9BACT|nr:long-chain fatty acid--CoA ligase [Candidatus Kryptonium thompsoni]CUS83504.1 long-chain acyl-CoA synthetase [Candidatus Kryptonium thompsoni]CUS85300.1 long-chain acyl-CoA synthetase [Candidatus Kryptonium thompsoni]CUS92634.1 long-chain acyl-CoA synthetase [Candidatus Kryptonium thompsoni]CUS95024.1 long-chain acyl-CoA synthetase [Candidatus Kryptonium thompsoni]CUS99244.1 long-chain acyl-CoA synthetase [Candidatus Kryptonium thompsoni]
MQNFQNLAELFEFGVKTYRNPKLLNYKSSEGVWKSISADEALNRVKNIALGLYQIGIGHGDKVALLSESRPEWTLTDLGIISLGAIDVPIYTTQALPQVEFILKNSESKLIFISTKQLYERVLPALRNVGLADKVITFEKVSDDIMTLEQLEAKGEKLNKENPELYDQLKSKVNPDDLATIIYTSGTTGDPKGVMLTHSNLISNAVTCASLFTWNATDEVALTYLPLSHIFERMIIYLYLSIGIQIWYAESIDKLADNLLEVRPTVMTTVPRFLEKAEERMLAQVQKMSPLKRKLFNWAMDIARQYDPEKKFPISYRIKHKIADILVYKKLRQRFGGRFRFIVSGGAALRPDLARIFTAAGIPVLQGYGLTETSPVISVNRLERNRIGSVGPVIPGVAVKIAEDGEILVDGPNVMKGYYKNEVETQKAFYHTWFKTGDIGYLDKDGFLFITDRKKDLIKTSGGKFIAPQAIENLLSASVYVDKAVVIGEGRKFASALIFPNFEALKQFAQENNITYSNNSELVNHPKVQELYQKIVDDVNQHLAQWETIKKFAVIDGVLTIDDDYLTPTLKVKRRNVESRYRDLIESFYKE